MFKYLIYLIFLVTNLYANNIESMLKNNPNDVLIVVDNIRSIEGGFLSEIEVTDENLATNKKTIFNLIVGAYNNKSFAVYTNPNKFKGHSILNIDNNIWIYVPNTSNPIKISPQQKMIGQASVADITSIVFYTNYNVESFLTSNNNYVLKLLAKKKSVAYSKIELTINKQGMPLSAKFYALSGRLLKTMEIYGVKNIGGAKRPTIMKITDEINNSLVTTVIFKTMIAKQFKEFLFTKENLKRISTLQF